MFLCHVQLNIYKQKLQGSLENMDPAKNKYKCLWKRVVHIISWSRLVAKGCKNRNDGGYLALNKDIFQGK